MIYTKQLHDLIIHRHRDNGADHLMFLGGFIGPKPIELIGSALSSTSIRCDIIYGCFQRSHLSMQEHNKYRAYSDSLNVNVYYKQRYNHSKIYMWFKEGQPVDAIAGSANFSANGLFGQDDETLFDIASSEFNDLSELMASALSGSTSCLHFDHSYFEQNKLDKAKTPQKQNFRYEILSANPPKVRLFLGDKPNHVHEKSALNWGHGNAHVGKDCAYIPIVTGLISDMPEMFPNHSRNDRQGSGQGHRNKGEIADAIFDDGEVISLSFEGVQYVNDQAVFKQLTSWPKNNILGRYLRQRLGLASDEKITYSHLQSYGRDTIDITKIRDDLFEFDFSVS
ncbi:MAG: restriction endonuclease PLD domain-containing protein [Candidatus Puniceispirillaceae bacterium]